MNGLQAIQDRILSDAREKAAQIEEQADLQIAAIETAAEQEKQQLIIDARHRAETQSAAILNRARSMAALANRKTLLQARQDLIEQAIARSADLFCALPDDQKVAFYRQLLAQTAIKSGEVVLAADDQHLAGQILAGYAERFTLGTDAGSFKGGLILRSGLIEDNLTLDLLIANSRSEIIRLAADILFES